MALRPLALFLGLSLVSVASGTLADDGIMIADPYYGLLLQGRVLDAAGRPVSGALVERMADPSGSAPHAATLWRTRSDGEGHFEFEFSGIGMPTGRTWYLRASLPSCAGPTSTVELENGSYRGRDADVRRGVVLTLACPSARRGMRTGRSETPR